jgi:hypothetical protein
LKGHHPAGWRVYDERRVGVKTALEVTESTEEAEDILHHRGNRDILLALLALLSLW